MHPPPPTHPWHSSPLASSISPSLSPVLALRLRRNAFCCLCPQSHLFLLLFARLLFLSLPQRMEGWGGGWGVAEESGSGVPPIQLNNCHFLFADPRCWRKSFPYFMKGPIEMLAAASRYGRGQTRTVASTVSPSNAGCFVVLVTLKSLRNI